MDTASVNVGFTLRTHSDMVHSATTSSFVCNRLEDQFFALHLSIVGGHVPDKRTAGWFAVAMVAVPDPDSGEPEESSSSTDLIDGLVGALGVVAGFAAVTRKSVAATLARAGSVSPLVSKNASPL
jgi:hypothetical protein